MKDAEPQKMLTNIISLVRFAIGESQDLKPFPEIVNVWAGPGRDTGGVERGAGDMSPEDQ